MWGKRWAAWTPSWVLTSWVALGKPAALSGLLLPLHTEAPALARLPPRRFCASVGGLCEMPGRSQILPWGRASEDREVPRGPWAMGGGHNGPGTILAVPCSGAVPLQRRVLPAALGVGWGEHQHTGGPARCSGLVRLLPWSLRTAPVSPEKKWGFSPSSNA